ncbi:hypothetical protein EMCRGX_G031985 [Ephydatia muelleri]
MRTTTVAVNLCDAVGFLGSEQYNAVIAAEDRRSELHHSRIQNPGTVESLLGSTSPMQHHASSMPSKPASSASAICIDNDAKHHYLSDSSLNLLTIQASEVYKYALRLMDALFSEEEMSSRCYQQAGRGAPSNKPLLSPRWVNCMEDALRKFGKSLFEEKCVKICNQKCRDTKCLSILSGLSVCCEVRNQRTSSCYVSDHCVPNSPLKVILCSEGICTSSVVSSVMLLSA